MGSVETNPVFPVTQVADCGAIVVEPAKVHYPNAEKLTANGDVADKVAQFLEWLDEKKFAICEVNAKGEIVPVPLYVGDTATLRWVCDYLSIDFAELEKERREVLAKVQKELP